MNYPDSVRFLYALGNEIQTAKFGLERIGALLEALGHPERAYRLVHVAGTNGKGSTCAMIESGLRAAGLNTGLYTSPHLVEPTERIRIGGRPAAPEEFSAAFDQVHRAAGALLESGAIDLHPTYFETVTAMALLLFRELRVEIAVLEVGLGGRLDATNAVMPELAVITPVDFDHENYLGSSLESIAAEKAGILKPGVPAVFAAQRPEVEVLLARRAAELGIEALYTRDWRPGGLVVTARRSEFTANGRAPVQVRCPLAGRHQAENALAAVAALERLGVASDAIGRGIVASQWPGRLERVAERPEILLDGAHNPAGARALAAHIAEFYGGRKLWLVFGAMRDKAFAEMARVLFPLAARVIVTAPRQSRAAPPEMIRESASHEFAGHPPIDIAPGVAAALESARAAREDDVILVTGSLFLVGEARALLV